MQRYDIPDTRLTEPMGNFDICPSLTDMSKPFRRAMYADSSLNSATVQDQNVTFSDLTHAFCAA